MLFGFVISSKTPAINQDQAFAVIQNACVFVVFIAKVYDIIEAL
jgi:hypothetical protein